DRHPDALCEADKPALRDRQRQLAVNLAKLDAMGGEITGGGVSDQHGKRSRLKMSLTTLRFRISTLVSGWRRATPPHPNASGPPSRSMISAHSSARVKAAMAHSSRIWPAQFMPGFSRTILRHIACASVPRCAGGGGGSPSGAVATRCGCPTRASLADADF